MNIYVAKVYMHPYWGSLKKIYLEKLQHLGPRDHCPISNHLMDNKHLSNCQLRNTVGYVVVGHQVSSSIGTAEELGSSCLPCIKTLQLEASFLCRYHTAENKAKSFNVTSSLVWRIVVLHEKHIRNCSGVTIQPNGPLRHQVMPKGRRVCNGDIQGWWSVQRSTIQKCCQRMKYFPIFLPSLFIISLLYG